MTIVPDTWTPNILDLVDLTSAEGSPRKFRFSRKVANLDRYKNILDEAQFVSFSGIGFLASNVNCRHKWKQLSKLPSRTRHSSR